ncbi:stage III sporulation protein AA [Paenibacillus sp. NPDC056579]|uniref:stage III sporulation protein AA n=1 Tax=Paenibacillus sp. NPDC056579 TaxID=3345871 RepID=UPI00368A99C2
MQSLLRLFSVPLRQRLATLPNEVIAQIQEIRVREGRPLEIVWGQRYSFIAQASGLCDDPDDAYRPTRDDCSTLLEMLTQHSLYTFDEELRRGYITVKGGHRIGLAGRAVLEQGKIKHLKEISSFNIRIASERKGTGARVLPYLVDQQSGGLHHTLVVSPPQFGKTTLIRDLARLISTGSADRTNRWLSRGYKVGIVDERSEIAACEKGVPTFDLGPRTDVLDACPKAEGMMMMIRSMSPEVLVVDEIGRPEDAEAIHEALHAGIRVMATAHGYDLDDVRRRPVMKQLLNEEVFSRVVVLGNQEGVGTLQGVFDAKGQLVHGVQQIGSRKPSSPTASGMHADSPLNRNPGVSLDWTASLGSLPVGGGSERKGRI